MSGDVSTSIGTVDPGEALAVGIGALLVLVGIATIVGMAWQYRSGGIVLGVFQTLGGLATVGIGAGLAWLAVRA